MAGENNLSFEITVNGITQTITSVTQANKIIKQLAAEFAGVANNSQLAAEKIAQVNQVISAKQNLQAFSRGMLDASGNIGATATSSRNAAMAMLNMNYVIRDTPYFFNNFAMGVMAVGNNINPLTDSMQRLSKEAKNLGVSMGSLLAKQFMGSGGLMFVLSLAVSAFTAISLAMNKTGGDTKDLKNKVDDLRKSYEDMTNETLRGIRVGLSMKLKDAEKEALPERDRKKAGDYLQPFLGGDKMTQAQADLINNMVLESNTAYKEIKDKIDMIDAVIDSKGWEQEIKNSIREYEGLRKKALTPEIAANFQKLIDAEQKKLDDVLKTEKKRTKEKKEQVTWQTTLNELLREIGEGGRKLHEFDLTLEQESGQLMGGTKQPQKNPALEQIDKDLEKINKEKLATTDRMADIVGNSISNAFMSGKNAIDAATQALMEFIVQLIIIEGFKALVNSATGGVGGVVTGSLGKTTGGLGKMSTQIGGSKFSNIGGSASKQVVFVGLKKSGKDFVIDFKEVEGYVNRSVRGRSFDRNL